MTELPFPAAPTRNTDLERWLAAHNRGLLSILEQLYPVEQIRQFTSAEKSACEGRVYCQMAFRQQAVAFATQPSP